MVVRVDVVSNGDWNVLFPQGCDFALNVCNEEDNRKSIQDGLQRTLGRTIRFQLISSSLPPKAPIQSIAKASAPAAATQPTLIRKYMEHPIVKSLLQSIDGEIVRVDPARAAVAPHLPTVAPVKQIEA